LVLLAQSRKLDDLCELIEALGRIHRQARYAMHHALSHLPAGELTESLEFDENVIIFQ
jgi:hypothetical protein